MKSESDAVISFTASAKSISLVETAVVFLQVKI